MAKVRQVLKHVSIETAKAKRKCHRTKKHEIGKGDTCLVIKEGAMAGSKNYCDECAREILETAQDDLSLLKQAFEM